MRWPDFNLHWPVMVFEVTGGSSYNRHKVVEVGVCLWFFSVIFGYNTFPLGVLCQIYSHDAAYTLSIAGGLITSHVYTRACAHTHTHTHMHAHTHMYTHAHTVITTQLHYKCQWLQRRYTHSKWRPLLCLKPNFSHLS